MELTLEVREGVSSDAHLVSMPDASAAQQALRSMDGARISQLIVDDGHGQVLLIGGGNDGRYVVNHLVNEDEHSFQLLAPTGSENAVTVVTGGQEGLFPEKFVVDAALAEQALISFIKSGRRNDALSWHQEF